MEICDKNWGGKTSINLKKTVYTKLSFLQEYKKSNMDIIIIKVSFLTFISKMKYINVFHCVLHCIHLWRNKKRS